MNPGRARRRPAGVTLGVLLLMVPLVVACGDPAPTGSPDPGDSVAVETPVPSPGTVTGEPSGSPSNTSGPSPSASATPPAVPSETAQVTTRPTAVPTVTAGSGDSSVALCAKLPVTDVEAVLNVSGLAVRPELGNASAGSCTYLSGDRAVAATSWLTTGARQTIDTFAGTAEPVPGVADEAIWVQSALTLYMRKGDSLMGISVASAGPVALEDLKDACIALGQAAAGRL